MVYYIVYHIFTPKISRKQNINVERKEMKLMSIFTNSEKNFLSSLGDEIFVESSKSECKKVFDTAYKVLEGLGFTPNIGKKEKLKVL